MELGTITIYTYTYVLSNKNTCYLEVSYVRIEIKNIFDMLLMHFNL